MNKTRKYPPETQQRAEKMLEQGVRPSVVAKELKIPIHAVAYWNKKFLKKRVGKKDDPKATNVTDAVLFLRNSRKELMASIRSGKTKNPSRMDLYSLLALDALEGG